MVGKTTISIKMRVRMFLKLRLFRSNQPNSLKRQARFDYLGRIDLNSLKRQA